MNFEYIKKLLECGRHGKVIQLIKNNVHIWSMDDYQKVYDICCFNVDLFKKDNRYFSELCSIYLHNHTPDSLFKKLKHAGSIRQSKYLDNVQYIQYFELTVDELKYIIKTQSKDTYSINTIELYKCLIYEDVDMISKIQSQKVYILSGDTISITSILYEYYTRGEYAKGDKMYNMMNILNSPKTYMSDSVMNIIYKYRHIWKDLRDKKILKFCKYFIDNVKYDTNEVLYAIQIVGGCDIKTLNYIMDEYFIRTFQDGYGYDIVNLHKIKKLKMV
jgi:hypothetical protein